jgi:hypothetical protein
MLLLLFLLLLRVGKTPQHCCSSRVQAWQL